MCKLNHMFRFINLIKIESNRSKFSELFGLTLNTDNIKTPSIGTVSIETTSTITF